MVSTPLLPSINRKHTESSSKWETERQTVNKRDSVLKQDQLITLQALVPVPKRSNLWSKVNKVKAIPREKKHGAMRMRKHARYFSSGKFNIEDIFWILFYSVVWQKGFALLLRKYTEKTPLVVTVIKFILKRKEWKEKNECWIQQIQTQAYIGYIVDTL